MKFACASVVLLAAILGAQAVDWQSVKNLNIETPMPKVHGETLPGGRITGGQLAEPNQFPHQVGLLLYVTGGAAWCGGSIISERWVITAAHCTDSLTTGVDVYLGAHDRTNAKEEGQQIIFVERKNVIVHEDWIAETITNDEINLHLQTLKTFQNDDWEVGITDIYLNNYIKYTPKNVVEESEKNTNFKSL